MTDAAPRHGDPRLWFTWAVGRFHWMEDAPQPLQFEDTADWVEAFDRWASASVSPTCAWIARLLLGFWNSSNDWATGRGVDLHRAWANMDRGNRRGVILLLEAARFF